MHHMALHLSPQFGDQKLRLDTQEAGQQERRESLQCDCDSNAQQDPAHQLQIPISDGVVQQILTSPGQHQAGEAIDDDQHEADEHQAPARPNNVLESIFKTRQGRLLEARFHPPLLECPPPGRKKKTVNLSQTIDLTRLNMTISFFFFRSRSEHLCWQVARSVRERGMRLARPVPQASKVLVTVTGRAGALELGAC